MGWLLRKTHKIFPIQFSIYPDNVRNTQITLEQLFTVVRNHNRLLGSTLTAKQNESCILYLFNSERTEETLIKSSVIYQYHERPTQERENRNSLLVIM